MKILISSHHFLPSTGGIEKVTELLAREFVRRGHLVRVVTQTPGEAKFSFEVVRRPSAGALVAAVRWCDVFLQNNISLRTLWPLAIIRRPLFVIHQTWITAPDGSVGWLDNLKRIALRFGESFAISDAVAASLPVPSRVVGNPYDETIFRQHPQITRAKDLVFVGRLVSDKGADLLLEAIALLSREQLQPGLTLVGDGPEKDALEQQARTLGLRDHVVFVGMRDSVEIAALLNEHKILVVPSKWAEPFGIVALEGIACGCAVIGSAAGGLPEAIGPCGPTFPNGDVNALASAIAALLRDDDQRADLAAASGAHLAKFTSARIADFYLEAMAAKLK
ncbi:MAG: glycosyltransferase family 4 protein [Chthoniobacterales bacterium]